MPVVLHGFVVLLLVLHKQRCVEDTGPEIILVPGQALLVELNRLLLLLELLKCVS